MITRRISPDIHRHSQGESMGLPGQWSLATTLSLSAEERTRSRYRFVADDGTVVFLQLPRGTVLRDGDWLMGDPDVSNPVILRVIAKPEPVLTVRSANGLALLQAAYHLGNRHVPLEVQPNYLRLLPDPVLRDLLERRGLTVIEEVQPFQPEVGAYETSEHSHAPDSYSGHSHSGHSHSGHSHSDHSHSDHSHSDHSCSTHSHPIIDE